MRACHNLTESEKDEVKQEFAQMLTDEGICLKRATRVCDVRNVGIICGHSVRRRKRDVSSTGEVEETEQVEENIHFQMNVTALKLQFKDCDGHICPMLRIRARDCPRLCEPAYKRFLRAAVMYSKRQLTTLYSRPQRAAFSAAHRDFEAQEEGLTTSNLLIGCEDGMKPDGTRCGRSMSNTLLSVKLSLKHVTP